MDDLTDRQQAVLDHLRQHIAQHGSAPTLTEIAAAFGLASPNGVAKHLQALADKGHIELLAHKARGIRLLGPKPNPSNILELPLVGRVAAGLPILAGDHVERTIAVDQSLFRPRPGYLLRVQGQSMLEAGILDGDLIGVHPTPVAEHGQIVVARLGEEGITVKRLYRRGKALRLLPCNPAFAPIDPDPLEDFAVEGLYCGLIRTL
ncbi:transcriptional repressor LexA [Xanthomonas translucens]|uniref:LexA repressor n=2 Tax=Xanthomonas campestris pv. translucens TaxID=343 RepID=A0A125PVD4_XANCT|nr:transcriptional repressor LexA [Xanthomonas translucens]KWV12932.1 LexA family transcriptional regulator [Xanthomonas translucens]